MQMYTLNGWIEMEGGHLQLKGKSSTTSRVKGWGLQLYHFKSCRRAHGATMHQRCEGTFSLQYAIWCVCLSYIDLYAMCVLHMNAHFPFKVFIIAAILFISSPDITSNVYYVTEVGMVDFID